MTDTKLNEIRFLLNNIEEIINRSIVTPENRQFRINILSRVKRLRNMVRYNITISQPSNP
jgi:hypothetical protein